MSVIYVTVQVDLVFDISVIVFYLILLKSSTTMLFQSMSTVSCSRCKLDIFNLINSHFGGCLNQFSKYIVFTRSSVISHELKANTISNTSSVRIHDMPCKLAVKILASGFTRGQV